jgi:uncharacterized DUF497 family protein
MPEFEWDESKRRANLLKHGLDFADVALLEWDRATIVEDRRFGYLERRYWGFVDINNRLHLVAFANRGRRIRIISFRRANKKEVKHYGIAKE